MAGNVTEEVFCLGDGQVMNNGFQIAIGSAQPCALLHGSNGSFEARHVEPLAMKRGHGQYLHLTDDFPTKTHLG